MKKSVSFLLSIFIAVAVVAQSSQIDSLKNLLKTERKDTSRASLLFNIGTAYGKISSDSSLSYAFEAIKLADKTGYYPLQIKGRYVAGYILGYTGNFVKALQLLLQGKAIAQNAKDTTLTRLYYFYLGHLYKRQHDFRNAANSYLLSFNGASRSGQPEMNLGYVYLEMDKPDSSLFFSSRAYEIQSQINDSNHIPTILVTIARVHVKKANLTLAKGYLATAEQKLPGQQNPQNHQYTCLSISKYFDEIGDKDSSIYYAKQVLSYKGGEKLKPNLFDAATMLAGLYEGRNADSAYKFLKMSLLLNQEMLSNEKSQQLQALRFEDEMEQQKLALEHEKSLQERKHNLQYAAIALGALSFLILSLLVSHSVIANARLIKFLGILSLLIVFEFINLFIHPYLDKWTNHSIPVMLLVMVCIAAMLIPLHHKLEHWIIHRLVEKNKRIRLAAARKTIATLEGKETN